MKNKSREKNLLILLIISLIIPLFGNLGYLPIRLWDESRVAANAYEMFASGNFIVTTYEGKPEMWNTKPPLLIWIQALLMHVLGVNEWAIRLPSATAGFITCLSLYYFIRKYLNSRIQGVMAALILVTTQGFVSIHGTRTGDYDAMLVMFTTLSALSFFTYTEARNNRYLYLFFLFTALAVLTKSITGLMLTPAIFLYTVFSRQLLPLIKNKHFYIGSLCMVSAILSYYLIREQYNPGYLQAVYENELGGRYLTAIEQHNHGFWFYFHMIIAPRFVDWILFFTAGIIVGLLSKDKKIRKIVQFSTLIVVSYFLIISSAKTKLIWYDMPMYPFMAVIASVSLYKLFEFIRGKINSSRISLKKYIPATIIIILMAIPYTRIINSTIFAEEKGDMGNPNYFDLAYFLREAVDGQHNVDGMVCIFDSYVPENNLYIGALNQKGIKIKYDWWGNCAIAEYMIVQSDKIKSDIERNCDFEIIDTYRSVTIYKIL